MVKKKDLLDFYLTRREHFLKPSTNYDKAKYFVFGVPFDGTSTYRQGAKFFPAAVREASQNIEGYSLRNKFDIEEVEIYDGGDLNVLFDSADNLQMIEKIWSLSLKNNKKVIMLGGEHSITLGASRALEKDVTLLVFDAHFDVRDQYMGSQLNHATFLRRVIEERGPKSILHIGARAACKEEMEYIERVNLQYYSTSYLLQRETSLIKKEIQNQLSTCKAVYISIDMDVFDPSFAPAVGNPEPGGMSPTIIFEVIRSLRNLEFVGVDISEGCPQMPDCNITALLAAKILFEVISTQETSK